MFCFFLVEEEFGWFLYKEDGSPYDFSEIPHGGIPSSVRSQARARSRRSPESDLETSEQDQRDEERADRRSWSTSRYDSGISGQYISLLFLSMERVSHFSIIVGCVSVMTPVSTSTVAESVSTPSTMSKTRSFLPLKYSVSTPVSTPSKKKTSGYSYLAPVTTSTGKVRNDSAPSRKGKSSKGKSLKNCPPVTPTEVRGKTVSS